MRDSQAARIGAGWCAECRQWHARVFADPEVIRQSHLFARIQVDVTRAPEGAKKAFVERYGGNQPPVVVIFGRTGQAVRTVRSPPDAATFLEWLRAAEPPPPK